MDLIADFASLHLSSIYRLPPEILQVIFTSGMEGSSVGIWSPTSFSWRVSQVSSSWRAIANSTPALWSNIDFNHLRKSNSAVYRAQMCLDRAKDHLLSVSGTLEDGCDKRIMALLIGCSTMWVSASLRVVGSHLYSPPSLLLPELRRLVLQMDSDLNVFRSVQDTPLNAPKLIHLVILSTSTRSLHLPVCRLEYLSISSPYPSSILRGMSSGMKSRLKTVHLGYSKWYRYTERNQTHCVVPSVETLLLSCKCLGYDLAYCSFPNTKNIFIDVFTGESLLELRKMPIGTRCRPENVILCDDPSMSASISPIPTPTTFEPLMKFLSTWQTIHTLKICVKDDISRKLILSYIAYFDMPDLLPRLETICVDNCTVEDLGVLVDLVVGRLGFKSLFREHYGDPPQSLLRDQREDATPLHTVKFSQKWNTNKQEAKKYIVQFKRLSRVNLLSLDTGWLKSSEDEEMRFNLFRDFDGGVMRK